MRDIENPYSKAEVFVALIDNGICNFYELNDYYVWYVG